MRLIKSDKIVETVASLCIKANMILRPDVLRLLKQAFRLEKNKRAKKILRAIIDNAAIASMKRLAICQDTGMPVVFLELGQDIRIEGNLRSAVNRGVDAGYRKGYLRNSVVIDPLARGKSGFYPAVIHMDIVPGRNLKISVLPKGFGCENKTQLKMFDPTAKTGEIKKFIVDAVKNAGPDACPPYVVGVGIGGTADYAGLLAKKALLRRLGTSSSKLQNDLLKEINKLNIGPMGLGGKRTALAVNIEMHPTHIAGLPVAVNISCHALRSATKTI